MKQKRIIISAITLSGISTILGFLIGDRRYMTPEVMEIDTRYDK